MFFRVLGVLGQAAALRHVQREQQVWHWGRHSNVESLDPLPLGVLGKINCFFGQTPKTPIFS